MDHTLFERDEDEEPVEVDMTTERAIGEWLREASGNDEQE